MESEYGKAAADAYTRGVRSHISNKENIIGAYGVNKHGATPDMYDKGTNLIHTIRQLIHSDDKFRSILRGINKEFSPDGQHARYRDIFFQKKWYGPE